MHSPPALPCRERRSPGPKLTPRQRADVYAALTRPVAPARARAIAETFGLDVSSVHRIRRTYRPPAPPVPYRPRWGVSAVPAPRVVTPTPTPFGSPWSVVAPPREVSL